jgi:hypothetical protein
LATSLSLDRPSAATPIWSFETHVVFNYLAAHAYVVGDLGDVEAIIKHAAEAYRAHQKRMHAVKVG